MDVFNHPPAISEDTLFYELYPLEAMADKASVTTLAVVMQGFAESLIPDMQWHRDGFELKVSKNPDSGSYMLEGTMRVGDCVDDEWCAVWILREISAKWDVAIRVFDTDGEFLLIEAADHLPDWVNPSNALNRVWVYNSNMHLISVSHISSASAKEQYRLRSAGRLGEGEDEDTESHNDFISVQDAIRLLRDPLEKTRVSDEVATAVWQRISKYPNAARAHVHHTSVIVPFAIAQALSTRPALVQKAVETFYTRDALQLRAAHRMARFPPEPSVKCTIKLTRTAYAQLVGQKFYPPKVFGRFEEREGTSEWRWRDLGMKIACGFEMLYQETKGRTSKLHEVETAAANSARIEALRHNSDYCKFVDNLRASGYFKGEIQGSRLWTELEDKAAAAFVDVRHTDDATRPSFSSQVDSAIATAGKSFSVEPEDSDDWLNVDVDDFDALLSSKMQNQSAAKEAQPELEKDTMANEQASRLKSLAQKVEEFVEGEGDVEGARFADELFSDDSTSDSDDEDDEDGDTQMRTESQEQKRATRQAAIDALVPGIEPAEYGKMPSSFHRNSQRVARDEESEETHDGSTSAPAPSVRAPLLTRDRYEGVDSDDESDSDESDAEGGSEDDRPQLVDEIEIDMSEEQEEFLEFARQALGVSDQQWRDIVTERKDRGAFVPESATDSNLPKMKGFAAPSAFGNSTGPSQRAPEPKPNLDSFEELMRAMDAELARSRSGLAQAPSSSPPADVQKGKGKATVEPGEEDADSDVEAAMDAELRETLERNVGDEEDGGEIGGTHYNLIKNFLESFKSQGGLTGPVGNLAGRLQPDWTLPRDAS
ncbi:SGT1 protein-domain-containing protein [Cytidiella melzeri]|nr:SGT1 protein-domain-containing protein [Cytidiella melzeri]